MTTARRRAWQVFAGIVVLMILPELFSLMTDQLWFDRTRHLLDVVAAVGVVGYAFGRQIGPVRFWVGFAPVFVLFTVGVFALGLGKAAAKFSVMPGDALRITAMMAAVAPIAILSTLVCVAVLRYGGWMARDADVRPVAEVFN